MVLPMSPAADLHDPFSAETFNDLVFATSSSSETGFLGHDTSYIFRGRWSEPFYCPVFPFGRKIWVFEQTEEASSTAGQGREVWTRTPHISHDVEVNTLANSSSVLTWHKSILARVLRIGRVSLSDTLSLEMLRDISYADKKLLTPLSATLVSSTGIFNCQSQGERHRGLR